MKIRSLILVTNINIERRKLYKKKKQQKPINLEFET